jgi:hypothetical protein
MHETRRLVVAKPQRVEHGVEVADGSGPALHGQARGLVKRNDRVVAIEHERADKRRVAVGDRPAPAPFPVRRRGLPQRRHAHLLPGLQPESRLGPLAVNADLSGAQKPLQPAMAQCREMQPEPAVEPEIRLVRPDIANFDAAHVTMVRTRASPANSPPTDSVSDNST